MIKGVAGAEVRRKKASRTVDLWHGDEPLVPKPLDAPYVWLSRALADQPTVH